MNRTARASRLCAATWLLATGMSMAACSGSSPLSPTETTETAAPSIATQPQNQTITAGGTATLTVSATGGGTLTYQWYQGPAGLTSAPIGGATAPSFTTPALTATSSYWTRVSNQAGSVDSSAATVTVSSTPLPPSPPPPSVVAPSITSQPANQSVTSGQSATLNVGAAGTGPLVFQWYSGASGDTASPIAGATSSSYTTPPLTSTISYWVRVSNGAGTISSDTVTVTVSSPPSGSSSLEDEVLVLVNQRRASGASCGGTLYPAVAPLTLNVQLRDAARGHSQDMAANNYFSHTSQNGKTFDQRISQAGYTGGFPLGENIAGGAPSAQAVVDGWMQSTGHCQNIMNGGFHVIGVGYAFNQSSTYRHYWTQNFGGG